MSSTPRSRSRAKSRGGGAPPPNGSQATGPRNHERAHYRGDVAELRAEIQRVAYQAAVEELRDKYGFTWTDSDTEVFRSQLGVNKNPTEKEAREILARLTAALRSDGVMSALHEVVRFAEEHAEEASDASGTVLRAIRLGEIDGPAWHMRGFADLGMEAGQVEHNWRVTLAEYAATEIGWWTRFPTDRTLALLSVLAGIPSWSRTAERLRQLSERRSNPINKGVSGRDAIAAERRAMAGAASKAEPLSSSWTPRRRAGAKRPTEVKKKLTGRLGGVARRLK